MDIPKLALTQGDIKIGETWPHTSNTQIASLDHEIKHNIMILKISCFKMI